jgi:hypothetical protein
MQLWGIQLGRYSAHYAFRGHALREGCLYEWLSILYLFSTFHNINYYFLGTMAKSRLSGYLAATFRYLWHSCGKH